MEDIWVQEQTYGNCSRYICNWIADIPGFPGMQFFNCSNSFTQISASPNVHIQSFNIYIYSLYVT